jgi:hypothetical protein
VKKLRKLELLSRLLKAIAIVITLLFLMTLGSCSSQTNIKEPCLKSVTTYGEALECAIKLNEIQK